MKKFRTLRLLPRKRNFQYRQEALTNTILSPFAACTTSKATLQIPDIKRLPYKKGRLKIRNLGLQTAFAQHHQWSEAFSAPIPVIERTYCSS